MPPNSRADRPPDRSLGVYLVDVGQGDATVVLPPAGEGGAVVFDCRDDHAVGALLRNWNVERISAVIASHLDLDHIAGLTALLASFGDRIDRVFLSTDREVEDGAPGAKTARTLIAEAVAGRRRGAWELVPNTRDPRPVVAGDGWSVSLIAPEHAAALERAVTDRCQPNIAADIEAFRDNVVRGDAFAEPPWRHLTDKTGRVSTRRAELPCAGTVVVRLSPDGGVRVHPAEADHDKVVGMWRCPRCRTASAP